MNAATPAARELAAASRWGGESCDELALALSLLLRVCPLESRARAACVCRAWRAAAAHPDLWQELRVERGLRTVTPATLASLCARAGAGLRTLSLHAYTCSAITTADLLAALRGGGCTGTGHLSATAWFTAEQAQQLAAACPMLRHSACKIECSLAEAAAAWTALPGPLTVKCRAQGEADAALLAQCLRDNASVTALTLNDHIGVAGATQLAACLRTNTTLTSLHLAGSGLGDEGAAQLAQGLGVNTTLTSLRLIFCGFGVAGATRLAECLRVNKTLSLLHLSLISIGDEGAAQLAEGLRVNTTLKTLSLVLNEIGAAGISQLAECLRGNTGLTTFHTVGNNIGNAGVTQLAACLRVNTTVTTLVLQNTHMDDAGAMQLADYLRATTTLTSVRFCDHTVGDVGKRALQEACPPQCTLRLL